jgi:hypothetical protein
VPAACDHVASRFSLGLLWVAVSQANHSVIIGKQALYQVSFNHRKFSIRASEVSVTSRPQRDAAWEVCSV